MTAALLVAALLVQAHPGGARCATFRQDGKTLATVGDDGMLQVWSMDDGRLLRKVKATSTGHLTAVSQSPDGRLFVTTGYDGKIRLWDAGLKLIRSWSGGTSYVSGLAFSPDGLRIYSCGYDNRARSWNLNGKLVKSYLGLPSDAYGMALSKDGHLLTAVGPSGGFVVWRTSDAKVVVKGTDRTPDFCAASFDQQGKRVAIGALRGRMEVWDLTTKLKTTSVDLGDKGLIGLVWTSEDAIAAASYRDEVYSIDADTGSIVQRMQAAAADDFLMGLSIDHRGFSAATCDSGGHVKVWNTKDWTLRFVAGRRQS